MSFRNAVANWAIVGIVALLSAGCGFQPIYSGRQGAVIQGDLSATKIEVIEDRTGQLLHNELLNLINPKGRPQTPKYVLTVTLNETKQELAVKKSAIATRANLIFRASFVLKTTLTGSTTLVSGQSRITTSYNILAGEFATLAAEKDARQRAVHEIAANIANRLAAHFQLSGAG